MIHWLIQTQSAHPALVQGVPSGLLGAEETALFNKFKFLKRRQDWLLGRWTAKHLLQELIHQKHGGVVALDAISILGAEDGAPQVQLKSEAAIPDSKFTVSISHAQRKCFCAALKQPLAPVGAGVLST